MNIVITVFHLLLCFVLLFLALLSLFVFPRRRVATDQGYKYSLSKWQILYYTTYFLLALLHFFQFWAGIGNIFLGLASFAESTSDILLVLTVLSLGLPLRELLVFLRRDSFYK